MTQKTKSQSKKVLQHSNIFKKVVENTSNLVIITDIGGKIVYGNKALEKTTGYTLAEILGKTPKLWGGLMKDEYYTKLWKTIKDDKKEFRGEIQNKRKNGETYHSLLSILPLEQDSKILGFIGIEEDISKLKQLDQKKTEFISVVSHQLRTPLGSMRWNIEMLLKGEFGQIPKPVKEIIKQVYESNLRIISLVGDFLSASRIEQDRVSDNPQKTNIVDLIKMAGRGIEMEAQKKGIIGEMKFGKEKIPKIFIDPKLLHEVLHNLLSNAVKYSKRHGRVIIRVRRVKNNIQVSITNTGIGIPEKDKKKIFSKYFRAESAARSENEGSGLGLFIVKSYIEKWGGKIWFKSKVNKETTFTFTLPIKNHEQI